MGDLIIWLVPDWTLRRLAYRAEKQILRRPPSRTSPLRCVASRSTTELFARPFTPAVGGHHARWGIKVTVVSWLTDPEEHDYPAAGDYLGLIAGPRLVAVLVEELRRTQNVHRKAKDILRASGLPLLPTDNPHVASDLKMIRKTQPISPILLVRGDVTANRATQIADGYHRVCASYHIDENTDIPCRLVDLPPGH